MSLQTQSKNYCSTDYSNSPTVQEACDLGKAQHAGPYLCNSNTAQRQRLLIMMHEFKYPRRTSAAPGCSCLLATKALSWPELPSVTSISICRQATFDHITMIMNLYETWISTNGLRIWSTRSHLANSLFLVINLMQPENVGEGPGQALCWSLLSIAKVKAPKFPNNQWFPWVRQNQRQARPLRHPPLRVHLRHCPHHPIRNIKGGHAIIPKQTSTT